VRLALLSTARINELLVGGARQAAGIEVVAIASRERARAEAQAAELGIESAYGSYQELLAAPDVEAVYVALPNSMHVEWSIRALEAGKHVLCEKPMSRHPDDVERAFEAAERADRALAEAFMWRHHPQAKRLRALLSEVEPTLIRAAFSFRLDRPGDVRLAAELDGGALMDVGCYCVSAARLVAGEPVEVAAEQVVGPTRVDVRLAGTMRFPGDVLAVIDCGLDVAERDELEIVGAEGSLFLDDPWHSRRTTIEVRRAAGPPEHIDVSAADPYACELEDFAAAVAGRRPAPFGRADAVGQARAIAALYESAASGRTVALSEPVIEGGRR
jgi:predicted dehydrogenase